MYKPLYIGLLVHKMLQFMLLVVEMEPKPNSLGCWWHRSDVVCQHTTELEGLAVEPRAFTGEFMVVLRLILIWPLPYLGRLKIGKNAGLYDKCF
ncbi:hypothetical protein C7N83_05190 [Neisseria iguanae]|uniref:Uncharacterized protein n=1 Tax=Neisseria iguanae TaxID=90242 RepID=A0A2P7U0W4_9NEIS|nr:hypothetical protein C7N83_05190 [Neisseria iguanae]